MKPMLLFQAPIQTRSGYGEHARDLLKCLVNMNRFDIKVWGTRWGDTPYLDFTEPRYEYIATRMLTEPTLNRQPDVYMQVTVPNEFQTLGKYNIGITAGIETTHVSAPWVEGMNRMHLNIVPSAHSKKAFDDTEYTQIDDRTKQPIGKFKVTKPIEVLFEGVDTSVFKHDENILSSVRHELKSIKEDFCFLYVGHWLNGDMFHDRKDVGGLIKVFLDAFKNVSNPPALILKTSLSTMSVMDRVEIMKRIKQIQKSVNSTKPLPNVYVLHGELTAEEMNSLYNHPKVKAHISFTKGEGFGRPLLEASLSRKPVIAPNWSGHVDFLNPKFSVLLPGQLGRIHPSAVWDGVLIAEASWFTINYQVAANVMMQVWKNYPPFKQKALNQGLYSEQNFSLDAMQTKLGKLLDEHLPEFPDEVVMNIPNIEGLKLPKLKPLIPHGETTVSDMHQVDAKQMELPSPKTEMQTAQQPREVKNDSETGEQHGPENIVGNIDGADNVPSV